MKVQAIAGGLGLGLMIGINSAIAQVTPDGTLPTTVTTPNNLNFTINGGARSGANLFHSFSQFSVPTGGAAAFNNALDVQTIFARVTGGSVSNIDGLLQANGTASLYLLNAAGILFGPNARLNLGGSFVASTANIVHFADGVQFNTTNTTTSPLLTVSVPVGLQLGPNAGPIQVQGTPATNFFFRTPSLAIAPKQTLALVGGQVDINSASLSAPDGHVELWALQNGTVSIPTTGNWQLASSSSSPTWGTVTLRQASYLSTNGAIGGAINIRGRGLTVQDGSQIESSTGTNGYGQGITVQTTEFVDLLGISDPANYIPAGLATSVTGSGATAGDITVETPRLRLTNSAWISSLNYGINYFTFMPIANAKTGNIAIRATDIEVNGYTPFANPTTGVSVAGAITTLVAGGQQNDSGAITVKAERIQLLDGGRISSDLLGFINFFTGQPNITTGKAGDIAITATQSLDIRGTTSYNFNSAVISSVQNLVNGQGGNITINAGQLNVAGGGTISSAIAGSAIAANAGQGIAGNITIHANEVQVSDPVIDSYSQGLSGITVSLGQNATGQGGNIYLNANRLQVFNGGQITSSSEGNGTAGNVNLNVNTLDVQGLSQAPVNGQWLPSAITASATNAFAAGSVNITADTVQVRDRAEITVSNSGTGDAGNLNIAAQNIFLDNGASLRAEVNGGEQGNINLQVRDLLLLRHGSNITTNAQGASTGGNITINAGFIVAKLTENSDIVANAVLGSGGKIQLTAQGIFGLRFQPRLTPDSDITASSQFGVNGTVNINTIAVTPTAGLAELPTNFTDSSQQIATGCAGRQGSSFVMTGRGGVPQNPTQQVESDRPWEDLRDLSAYQHPTAAIAPAAPAPHLIQADSLRQHPDGSIELVASSSPVPLPAIATCANAFMTPSQSHR